MKKQNFWTVPEKWPGQTFAILAGGPSLTIEQVNAVKGKCRVIAVNNTYQLAPWADVLYGCDRKWWAWHTDAAQFEGIKVTMSPPVITPDVHLIRNAGTEGLCLDRDGLATGRNGGYQAINLAVHLGAKRILLLGFDMKAQGDRMHWHKEHEIPTPKTVCKRWLDLFNTISDPLKAQGVEVINCTPGSALKVFPKRELGYVIKKYGHEVDSL